jgi:hypothetical protein
MARLLIEDVTLLRDRTTITAQVRLRGGQAHSLHLAVPPTLTDLRRSAPELIAELDQLIEHHTDGEIAALLNDRGLRTFEGKTFTKARVQSLRVDNHLRSRAERLRTRGLLDLAATAAVLHISPATVKDWHHAGLIAGERVNDKGEFFYEPPGPNPPVKRQGSKLSKRASAKS